ncbi:MAG TPA: LptE family protein [Bacteroidales bacterium]|nr:LptE family protein [Bacteroidales bacterium]
MGLTSKTNLFSKLKGPVLIPVIIILAVTLPGCKVTYSFSGASISQAVKTINVQYFQNRASLVQPWLSQYFTDELMDKCRAQTNLQFVNDFGDVNFEGEIADYRTQPLTVSGNATAAMNRFTIAIRVKFTNTVEPEFSYDKTFSRYEDYSSSKILGEVEQELSEKIIEQLIEDIFNEAFVNW